MGMYIVTLTDSLGCKGYDSVLIENPDTLKISFNAINITCNGFNDGSIIANVSGGFSPYVYQWSTGDSVNSIDSLPPGYYQFMVYDSNQCIVKDSIEISEPEILTDTAIVSDVKCFGGNDGKIELIISGGTQPYSYDWPISGNSNSTDSMLIAGKYYVNITDSNGCFISDTFTITQPTPIVIQLDSSYSTCSYSNGQASVIANGGSGSLIYLWSNGDTDSVAENLIAGIYYVNVSDSNGCMAIDSISIYDIPALSIDSIKVINGTCYSSNDASIEITSVSGAGPFSYNWSPITASDQIVTSLSSGLYTVVVSDTNLCTDTMQISITEPDSIILLVQDTVNICYGSQTTISVLASGGNGGYIYVWDNGLDSLDNQIINPLSDITYHVTVVDSMGCVSDTAEINVIVNAPLSLTLKTDSSICQGDAVILSAKASGGVSPYNYSWNGGLYSGDSISVSITSTSNFIVTVSDNCGSDSVQDSVEVIVNPLPITSMYFGDTEGCSPVTVDFGYSTDIGDSLIWDFGDGTFSNDTNPQHTFNNPGTYNVSLTTFSSNGCKNTSSNSAYVTVFSLPSADFYASPDSASIIIPMISFNDLSSDAYSWNWEFGDTNSDANNFSTEANPYHEFSDTGIYQVQLVVVNNNGCTDTIILPVKIYDTYIISVPNAFTPNGDGLNEVFIPVGYGTNPEGYSFSVFDRWGDEIFNTTEITQGWDGTVNGGNKKAQIDVYIWKLHIKDIHENYHDYIGKILLLE
jgi:gliding motility-associated-like protein